jgi:hypothetical protein
VKNNPNLQLESGVSRFFRQKGTDPSAAAAPCKEHLFTLRQSVGLYREYQRRIAACEEEMQRLMKGLETKADPTATLPPPKDSVKKCRIMPPARAMALREEAYRILGVDLTTISGYQRPACPEHPGRAGWRRFEIPEFRGIQLLDGPVPG